jgi:uncharacterized protein (TIGR00369 family)
MTGFTARDPDFAARVERSFARQTMMATIGASLLRVAPGEVDIALAVAPHIFQQHGFIHGGAITSVADSAAGYAALTLMEAGAGILAVEFKINLLAPGRGERLVAEGRVVRPGRTLTVSQANVYAERDGRREAVALLTATLMRLEGRDGVVD